MNCFFMIDLLTAVACIAWIPKTTLPFLGSLLGGGGIAKARGKQQDKRQSPLTSLEPAVALHGSPIALPPAKKKVCRGRQNELILCICASD
jgi:hypothetical protein